MDRASSVAGQVSGSAPCSLERMKDGPASWSSQARRLSQPSLPLARVQFPVQSVGVDTAGGGTKQGLLGNAVVTELHVGVVLDGMLRPLRQARPVGVAGPCEVGPILLHLIGQLHQVGVRGLFAQI